MKPTKIQFRDLSVSNPLQKKEILEAVDRVLTHGQFMLGPEVEVLENKKYFNDNIEGRYFKRDFIKDLGAWKMVRILSTSGVYVESMKEQQLLEILEGVLGTSALTRDGE